MPGIGTSKSTQTATTTLDAPTQAALDNYRQTSQNNYGSFQKLGMPGGQAMNSLGFASQRGLDGVDAYMNPYQDEVIGGVNSDFDRQRAQSRLAADDEAAKAGAFGGDRAAVYKGVLERGVNQNEADVVSRLRAGGWQDAVMQLLNERGRHAGLYQNYASNQDAALGRMGYG